MSKELLASKVVVIEEDPKIQTISAAATSVAGAVGLAEKGPVNTPVLCTSFDEYRSTFGGFTARPDLALAAMGFFENGGSQLWVGRVMSPTATYATAVLVGDDDDVLSVQSLLLGAEGNRLSVQVVPRSPTPSTAFDFLVYYDGVLVETFVNLSRTADAPRYFDTIVNDPRVGSRFVVVGNISGPPYTLPDAQDVTLQGGDDGLAGLTDADFIGDDSLGTGLYALDSVQDLSILLVPGRATPAMHNAMVAYCEVIRDGLVLAVLDPPPAISAADMVTYVTTTAALENASEYGAIYWPRVKVLNPDKTVFGSDELITAPPSGIVAGVYARTDSARPGGVYDPPAGTDAGRTFGVLGYDHNDTLKENKLDLVYPHRINPLTTEPGFPKYIDGSRTLDAVGSFPFVAERRGVIFIERSLSKGLAFVRHQENTPELRAQVRRTITAFLITQMNNGAFRSREPAKAFFVDVSDALNPPSAVAAGKLVARIGLATNKPAEFVVLQISQDTRALDEELAAG